MIQYDWKIDFAIVLSVVSILISIVSSVFSHRHQRKKERIRAYEEVYSHASFILEYAFHKRSAEVDLEGYHNEDPALEKSVREYLDAHWMSRMWGSQRFVPSLITDPEEKSAFLQKVSDEASKYQNEKFQEVVGMGLNERSPVYHIKDDQVAERMVKIINHVGVNLSLFSNGIKKSWESVKFRNPDDVRRQYEQCLSVCKNFFKHNPRDFDDPFYDLLEAIRQEYRQLTRSNKQRIRSMIFALRWRLSIKGRKKA